MEAFTIGSSMYDISDGSGRLAGLVISRTVPSVLATLYITDGAVVIISRLNSLSTLSWIISIWSNPKNPHLKPKPKANDVSGSNDKAASFIWSFSKASFNSPYLAPSTG